MGSLERPKIESFELIRAWDILQSTLQRAQALLVLRDVSRIMRKSSPRICDLPKEPPQRPQRQEGRREGGREADYILPRPGILRRSKKCSKDCMREGEREGRRIGVEGELDRPSYRERGSG